MPKGNQILDGIADLAVPSTAPAGIFYIRKVFTDAQIKALPTTALEIIPAPGVGKVLFPIGGFIQIDVTAGVYTNVAGGSDTVFIFRQGGNASEVFKVENALGDLNDEHVFHQNVRFTPSFWDGDYGSQFAEASFVSSLENRSITLRAFNSGDFTGGNAANTLTVTVAYLVLPT